MVVRASAEVVEPARPTRRAVVPFVVIAMFGFAVSLLPPYGKDSYAPWLALLVLAVAMCFGSVSLRRSTRTWVDPVGPWIFFVSIAILRDASGGSASGLALLVVLPSLWVALFGRFSDLLVCAGLTVLTFMIPVWLIGGAHYPATEWRRAFLYVLVELLVVPVVQQVVRQLAVETRRERDAAAQIQGIMRGATLSGLIATDTDGLITHFSAGAEQLLGYAASDMEGHQGPGVFHDPDEVAAAATELGVEPGFDVFRALGRLGSSSRIWTWVRSDGRRIFVRLAVTELHDSLGSLVGYLGVAIDSTQAVEAERALTLAEERWRVAMDHLPDTAVLIVDSDMRIDVVTGAGAMSQGLTDGVGKKFDDVAKPENAALLTEMVRAALRGEEARGELSATRTGAEHEIQACALPASSTGVAQALLLARDVSRDRAREREARRARDQAERLFTDAPQGIAVVQLDGRLVRVNSAFCAVFRRTEEDLLGRSLLDLGRADDQTISRHLDDLVTGSSGRSETSWLVTNPDGQKLYATLSSVILPSDKGGAGHQEQDLALVNVVDDTERHHYEQQLAHLADHDPLTGLANRRRFTAELERHLEFGRRYGHRGAILLLDLDHFKEVNDTLGHPAGDQLIVSIATLLRQAVRSNDIVARLGGDEFAILLQEVDRQGAELVAGTVVARTREHVRTLDGTRRNVTASVGVVLVDEHNDTATDVLAAADMMMYDAKDAGRDQWAMLDYGRFEQSRTGARLAWSTRIATALENDDFELHLQPILDVRRGVVVGAEALLRLADGPDLVYPDRFLYVAERTGLIVELDQWVLRRCVAMLADLQRRVPGFRLEVNVSGKSIGNVDLERALVESLEASGADPTGLVLEITETSAVADVETARAFAERIAQLGCSFALDDFGAGFGSFYYLKYLLFDYIKIDGEFVANCHANPTDRIILRSIVRIANELGKRTIAEFVADPEVLEVVRAEGVDFAQGYHIGKPVPVEEFVAEFIPRCS